MNKRTSGFESAIGNMCADVDVFIKKIYERNGFLI